jgi:heterodisulfide reductase subunit A
MKKNGGTDTMEKRVVVIGGGIAGLTASLTAAELGNSVLLIEKAPSIGGMLERLDTWFVDDACGMCQILPQLSSFDKLDRCLRRDFFHPNIEIKTLTEVASMSETEDGMVLTLKRHPRYVDEIRCTACRLCEEVCPEDGPDPFDRGFTEHKAIHTLYAGSLTKIYYIDKSICSECGKCVEICPTKAIDLNQTETEESVLASSIIVAAGFTDIDPTTLSSFGYGKCKNVLTSLDFERLVSRSGAHPEQIVRPSDGIKPKSIAIIQCVGSRDKEREYCSSACCMYAVKEARKIKEISEDIDVSIFYMDLRAFGKGHYRYVLDARQKGVNFKNFRIPSVSEDEKGCLEICYEADGKMVQEQYDLVILSTGQEIGEDTRNLLSTLGVKTDSYGFASTKSLDPVRTEAANIFVAGSASEPKDIESSIIESRAAGFLASQLPPELEEGEKKNPEIDYRTPKFGIFICQCGGAIQKTLDTSRVKEAFEHHPAVELVEEVDLVCQENRLETIMQKTIDRGITRIVFATCSPAKYEVLIRKTADEYGFNQSMIDILSLREHIAWAYEHGGEEEAIRRLNSIIERLRLAMPEKENKGTGLSSALVIGGGVAGLVAAKQLIERGVSVHIIEKSGELGGNARQIRSTIDGENVQAYLNNLIQQVQNSEKTILYLNAEVVSLKGSAGAFTAGIAIEEEVQHIPVGAVIVAVGASAYSPKEYSYGKNERIVTQLQFEEMLNSTDKSSVPKSVLMIQCVGSRNEQHPWCNRVCCSDAVKNALALKRMNHESEIAILYRDMMTYGKMELKFKEARESGVQFIRFLEEQEPQVLVDSKNLIVRTKDLLLDRELQFEPEMVVLSVGMVPHQNIQLAAVLGVSLDSDGFFKGANPKFRPHESEKTGIFFSGLCRTPCSIKDVVADATAAAATAYTFLQETALFQRRSISSVTERWCAGCAFCVEACPFDARYLDEEQMVVKVRIVNCVGCGNCVSVCPSGASKLKSFEDRQVLGMIDMSI